MCVCVSVPVRSNQSWALQGPSVQIILRQDLQVRWAEGKLHTRTPVLKRSAGGNGAHGLRLERAEKLNNRGKHGDYIGLLTSEWVRNRRLGERRGNIAGTSSGRQTCLRYEQHPAAFRLQIASAAETGKTRRTGLWLTGDHADACRQQHSKLTT